MRSRKCHVCKGPIGRPYKTAKACLPCAYAVQKASHWASREVRKAMTAGTLEPIGELDCYRCGRVAHCYDHRDYSKPLMVKPVCNQCNVILGHGKLPLEMAIWL